VITDVLHRRRWGLIVIFTTALPEILVITRTFGRDGFVSAVWWKAPSFARYSAAAIALSRI
jgi:hypothetical protein